MECIHEFDIQNNFHLFRVKGRLNILSDGDELKRLAYKSYSENGCNKLLFDMTMADTSSNSLAVFDTANPSKEMAQLMRPLKVAFLFLEISANARLFETAAVNRGFSIRIFKEMDKAVEWLKSEGNA